MTLSPKDAAQFFRLMWGLHFFVSQQRQLLPEVKSLEQYATLSSERKIIVRDALWENPDLIDSYVEKNPDGLSAEDLSIIRKWKGFVAGRFTIFRYLKDYTIFMGNSRVYGVLGLYDPLDEVFSSRTMPLFVDAVLLPYKGKVIYDGLCRPYNVLLGPGIRSGLNEEYLTAKQKGRIITSFESDSAPAKPPRQRRELDMKCEAVLAEIAKASEQLRGGTVIQSAALGLLRASAKVAQAAAQQPDDLDELWRSARQVQTALNRLQKALERAED